MKYIDLHTHSSASDGSDTPAQLVEKARNLGLAAIALTDHDTVSGLPEAMSAGKALGQRVIPGCELSTMTAYGSMHILGLWVPLNNPDLYAWLERLRALRLGRNAKMIEKLRDMGVDITLEEVGARASGSVTRPHFARVLLEKGYVSSMPEAFSKYIGEEAPAYVPKTPLNPEEAANFLNNLGATVVLAHPLWRDSPRPWLEDLVARLKNNGLSVLEVWHNSSSPEQSRWLAGLAAKYDLGLSGGSDYHGLNMPGIELGAGKNSNVRVPESVLADLEKTRRAKGLPC